MLNQYLFAITAALAATANAKMGVGPYFSFYNRAGPPMTYAQLDPALFPGQESPHLHSFDGGNAVAASVSFADTQSSECTTARIKPDKSMYWRPTLFWNGNGTGFYKVPEVYLKIYYKFMDGDANAGVSEFPEDFQMMIGDPYKRSDDGDNPGRVKWACLAADYSRIGDKMGFPKGFTSCDMALTAEITFPSCWNGKALDTKNPTAHMAYPMYMAKKGIDVCPETHKVARFPEIFIEFWYDVKAFNNQYGPDDVPWVLANGDPTGYGFHADFQNGWEKGVLEKAMAPNGYLSCGNGCGQEDFEAYFGQENVNRDDDAAFKQCSANPEFSMLDTKPIDKLPGCNPVQQGPARATQATGAGCAAAAATGMPSSGAGSNMTSSARPTSTQAGTSDGTGMGMTQQPASTQKPVQNNQPASSAGNSGMNASSAGNTGMNASPTDTPTLSKTWRGKGEHHKTSKVSDIDAAATPTMAGGNTALPQMSLAPSDDASASGAGGDDVCKPPVTVTITPTVYVTAGASGADATSCDAGTVTVTNTARTTVTVTAGSHMMAHKRHAHGHRF
jgi:hypothetical protein